MEERAGPKIPWKLLSSWQSEECSEDVTDDIEPGNREGRGQEESSILTAFFLWGPKESRVGADFLSGNVREDIQMEKWKAKRTEQGRRVTIAYI